VGARACAGARLCVGACDNTGASAGARRRKNCGGDQNDDDTTTISKTIRKKGGERGCARDGEGCGTCKKEFPARHEGRHHQRRRHEARSNRDTVRALKAQRDLGSKAGRHNKVGVVALTYGLHDLAVKAPE
jgi:hypothetical protein